jgi:hypothetical protein
MEQGEYLGRGRGGEGTGLTEGLAHLLDRFRAAAGTAVRALRLELTLLLVFYLQVSAHSLRWAAAACAAREHTARCAGTYGCAQDCWPADMLRDVMAGLCRTWQNRRMFARRALQGRWTTASAPSPGDHSTCQHHMAESAVVWGCTR